MNIVVLDIEKSVLKNIQNSQAYLQKDSKFYREFKDSIFVIYNEKQFFDHISIHDICDPEIINTQDIQFLNAFAKSRMIYNFEKEYPEVSLIIMSSGDKSKLIKIKRRD